MYSLVRFSITIATLSVNQLNIEIYTILCRNSYQTKISFGVSKKINLVKLAFSDYNFLS